MLRRLSVLKNHGLFAVGHLTTHNLSSSINNSNLPHLVFGERHQDPATASMQAELASELKKIGYTLYLEEMPEGLSFRKRLHKLRENTEAYVKLKKWMAEVDLDIDNETDVAEFFTSKSGNPYAENFQQRLQKFVSEVREMCEYQASNLATQDLLERLKQLDIEYRAIDFPRPENMSLSDIINPENIVKRDRHMTTAYLNAKQPVFGCVGLAHIPGIQSELLQRNLPKAPFIFFHLYSTPAETPIERGVREGKLVFHWPIHAINCAHRNKEEIVAQIKDIIKAHQCQHGFKSQMRAAM